MITLLVPRMGEWHIVTYIIIREREGEGSQGVGCFWPSASVMLPLLFPALPETQSIWLAAQSSTEWLHIVILLIHITHIFMIKSSVLLVGFTFCCIRIFIDSPKGWKWNPLYICLSLFGAKNFNLINFFIIQRRSAPNSARRKMNPSPSYESWRGCRGAAAVFPAAVSGWKWIPLVLSRVNINLTCIYWTIPMCKKTRQYSREMAQTGWYYSIKCQALMWINSITL